MLYIIFFSVCFFASTVGSICGIGGGVIIKPVLDSFGIMSVSAVSFLSGCSVLAMSAYSLLKSKLSKEIDIVSKVGLPLAIGGAMGGVIGKSCFQYILSLSDDKNRVGAIQAICLIVITLGTLVYTINKNKIKTYRVCNLILCLIIGLILGILSAFLGIGGGPINLVMLFFFFTMKTKVAAVNSIYIIFFSQLASLLHAIITSNIPEFPILILFFMVLGGLLGGAFGHKINKRISDNTVDKLFVTIMILMIVINIFNVQKYI